MATRLLSLLLLALAFGASDPLHAGGIPVPTDLSVSLTAEPSENLHPGDLVSFTLSITNHGPEPVDRYTVNSSPIYDELDVFNGGPVDCDDRLALTITDLENGFYYQFVWFAAEQDTPLPVGATRYCYFSLPYTRWAPAEFPVTFSPGTTFQDLDPSNDVATVVLHRADAAAGVPIPALSAIAALLLALLLTAAGGGMAWRRRRG